MDCVKWKEAYREETNLAGLEALYKKHLPNMGTSGTIRIEQRMIGKWQFEDERFLMLDRSFVTSCDGSALFGIEKIRFGDWHTWDEYYRCKPVPEKGKYLVIVYQSDAGKSLPEKIVDLISDRIDERTKKWNHADCDMKVHTDEDLQGAILDELNEIHDVILDLLKGGQ